MANKGKYTIKESKNGTAHFNLVAGNGEILASGNSKQAKEKAETDIMILQRYGREITNYEIRKSSDRLNYWVFLNPLDGDVILTSETMDRTSDVKRGIASAMVNSESKSVVRT